MTTKYRIKWETAAGTEEHSELIYNTLEEAQRIIADVDNIWAVVHHWVEAVSVANDEKNDEKENEMKNAIARLARARQIVTEQEAALAEMTEELYASPLGLYLNKTRENLQKARAAQSDTEAEVRKQALTIFAETGNKAPHNAIKIKIYTVLEYKDEDAINYAREHLPEALKLKLDKRIFKRAAQAIAMNFVAILQEPRATIARDLSEYLPEREGTVE